MRTENSIKNVSVSVIGQVLFLLIGFVGRSVFVNTLSSEYLGISGLFANILNMLSLAELGVGNAIIFSMYKPIADRDEATLKQLLNFYGKVYRLVGVAIAVVGVTLVPFLDFFIKGDSNIPHLALIYLLYLSNTAISYFYSYKCSVLDAHQKQYVGNLYRYWYLILREVIQMICLVVTHNFILYLAVQVVCSIYSNWRISKKAEEMYPWIKEIKKTDQLSPDLKHSIGKNIFAMFNHNLGAVIVNGTDNILLSKFAGLVSVGLYSNYFLILNGISTMVCKVVGAATASVGNLGVLENEDKVYSVYKSMGLINFWIYSYCTLCFWYLFQPFITLWLGPQYLLPEGVVLLICINFYVGGMRQVNLTFRDAMGLFWYDRYKPLVESTINLVMSVYLVMQIGMAGVFLGTLIGTITTSFWVEPYILYKHRFHRPLKAYMARYAYDTACMLAVGALIGLCMRWLPSEGVPAVIARLVTITAVVNGVYYALFVKTPEFKNLCDTVFPIIRRFTKK